MQERAIPLAVIPPWSFIVFQYLWKASGPINDKLQNMGGGKLQARSMDLRPRTWGWLMFHVASKSSWSKTSLSNNEIAIERDKKNYANVMMLEQKELLLSKKFMEIVAWRK